MIKNINYKKGLTLTEILIVIGIMTILLIFSFSTFASFGNSQKLSKDSMLIVETLRQAQSNTLNSKNSNQYGVHFETGSITLFTGGAYTLGAPTNEVYNLNSDTITNVTLNGGGNSVVFNKLSGGTDNDGSIIITSVSSSQSKNVTIYKTGLIE